MTREIRGHPLYMHVPWPGSETAEAFYERPAPGQLVTWHCQRGHDSDIVFAAGPGVAVGVPPARLPALGPGREPAFRSACSAWRTRCPPATAPPWRSGGCPCC